MFLRLPLSYLFILYFFIYVGDLDTPVIMRYDLYYMWSAIYKTTSHIYLLMFSDKDPEEQRLESSFWIDRCADNW